MSPKPLILAIMIAAATAGCKPQPIDIEVPQSSAEMTISSYTPDARTVYVSAGYSVSSMRRIIDTSTLADYKALLDELLIDSAIVLLRADGGQTDTLKKVSKGLYGRKDLSLQQNTGYTLIVEDQNKGKRVTARTTFMPQPVVDTMYMERKIGASDTLNRFHVMLSDARPGELVLVCYNTSATFRLQSRPLQRNLSALYDFQPRRLEILKVPDTCGGRYEASLTLQVSAKDTVLVQVSRIDGAFSEYLKAYKRGGGFFSQLSGEPINLPGNVRQGYGYFSMFLSKNALFDLNKH
jgi:hypothetical protein